MSLSRMISTAPTEPEVVRRLKILSRNCTGCKQRMAATLATYNLKRVTPIFWAATCYEHQPWARAAGDLAAAEKNWPGYVRSVELRIEQLRTEQAALGEAIDILRRIEKGRARREAGQISQETYEWTVSRLPKIEAKHAHADPMLLQQELDTINNALVEYIKELAETRFVPPRSWR